MSADHIPKVIKFSTGFENKAEKSENITFFKVTLLYVVEKI